MWCSAVPAPCQAPLPRLFCNFTSSVACWRYLTACALVVVWCKHEPLLLPFFLDLRHQHAVGCLTG